MDDEGRSETLQAALELETQSSGTEDLEQIFRRHSGLVFRAAYRVTGNAVDAEDVLQTVFLRLARRGPDAAAVGGIESYLYRAAINTAVDVVRSRQRKQSIPLDSLEPLPAPEHSADPARAFSQSEIRLWLRNAIARLSPNAAEMFILRFFEGKANSEIARVLGTSASTVAVTLHRTRERLLRDFQASLGGRS